MVKVYYSLGMEEFSEESFLEHLLINQLKPTLGTITSAKILERKIFSNKGNALDGDINLSDGGYIGLNIGGNPIGTGYETYIPFLDEMKCPKNIFGLYKTKSIIRMPIIALMRQDTSWGLIVPESFLELKK